MATFAQLLINAIIAGSVYALVGLGFSLIFSCVRFFHFAHAIIFTLGAYLSLAFCRSLGLPMACAVAMSVMCCILIGSGIDCILYRPLRRRGASSLILLLASLGLYVVVQNVISLIFGDDSKTIRFGLIQEGYALLGARITWIQLVTIVISATLIIALAVFLRATRIGRAIRAVASDPILADISGIDSDRVITICFVVGSVYAAIAGVLTAFDVDMSPTMGMNALMMGVVAAIIGGIGSVYGVAVGALLLGVARHLGIWHLGSQWQEAIAFIILLAFLLVWPEGVSGRKVKKATA